MGMNSVHLPGSKTVHPTKKRVHLLPKKFYGIGWWALDEGPFYFRFEFVN